MAQRLVSLGQGVLNWGVRTTQISWETIKLVASHNRMLPPNPAEFSQAVSGLSGFFGAFRTGTWRYVTVRDAAALAARGVEIAGFFYVGEMIGRRSVIGYNVEG
ncbi:hypothetical protein M427DRAFT_403203 [Gonapodya prolifera JEL478]|uniref:Uncharacterized protein n=1 Tax=Gonapodya prolifera (strain JEL478) TaxID=1344416 RepID=A0A139AUI5_GONPJ|nr:hypothetical protein M427DRAFT_403203 [Gonapodya prolifera JEL478]|eukprot:KXS20145.1 hypothetical protein M427DRAFT_403203 [Gonapodya prolifera JEL478]